MNQLPGFWIDIESAAGVTLGVIRNATSWTSSPQLSKAGTFSFSLPLGDSMASIITPKTIAHCYAIIDGSVTEIGAGIVDRKEASVTTSPATWRVSGSDLLRELTYRSVFDMSIYTDTEGVASKVFAYDNGGSGFIDLANTYDDDTSTSETVNYLSASDDFIFIGYSEPFNFLKMHMDDDAGVGNNTESELNYGFSDGTAYDGSWPELDVQYDNTIEEATGKPYAFSKHSSVSVPVYYDVFFQKDGGTWTTATVNSVGSLYWIRIDPSASIDVFYPTDIRCIVRSPKAADLSDIMAEAPTAWASWGGGSPYTTTTNGTYSQFAGETVLSALVKTAKKTGEAFRLGSGRQLHWLRKIYDNGTVTAAASGITAVRNTGSTRLLDNSSTCIITSLSVTEDTKDLVTRIYPYGAGTGKARVSLKNATVTMPSGPPTFTMDTTNNYIANTTAESTYGVIERGNVAFKDVHPADTTTFDGTETCNDLAELALNYLQRVSKSQTFLQLTVSNLSQAVLVGTTIKIIYSEYYDGVEVLNVDGDYIVLSSTTKITANGIQTTSMKVGTSDYWPATDGEIMAQVLEKGIVFESHPQAVDSRQVQTL